MDESTDDSDLSDPLIAPSYEAEDETGDEGGGKGEGEAEGEGGGGGKGEGEGEGEATPGPTHGRKDRGSVWELLARAKARTARQVAEPPSVQASADAGDEAAGSAGGGSDDVPSGSLGGDSAKGTNSINFQTDEPPKKGRIHASIYALLGKSKARVEGKVARVGEATNNKDNENTDVAASIQRVGEQFNVDEGNEGGVASEKATVKAKGLGTGETANGEVGGWCGCCSSCFKSRQ